MKNISLFVDKEVEKLYEDFRSRLTPAGDLKPKVTNRKCSICNKNLTSGRYYTCIDCKPELESDYGVMYE